MVLVLDQMKARLSSVLRKPDSIESEAIGFASVCIPDDIGFVSTWTGVPVDESGQAPVKALFYQLCIDASLNDGDNVDIALQRCMDIFYGCSPNQRMVNDLLNEVREESDSVRMFEKSIFTNTKVFCPTGPGGGVDATCSPGKAGGYTAPKQTASGYVPGTVGAFSGVDTSSWKADHPASQKIMKKIAVLEEAAAEGKWAKFHVNMSSATMESSSSKLLKTLLTAQKNLLEKKNQVISAPPPGAVPAKPSEPEYTLDDDAGSAEQPKPLADVSSWKKLGGKLGTEAGGTYEIDGKKFYVKMPSDVDRAKNELLTNKLYQLAGAETSNAHLVQIDGKTAFASEWVDTNGTGKIDFNSKANQIKAQADFAAHVWLNNRDAIGAGSENPEMNIIADKDGNFKIIDTGGGLDYAGIGGGGKKEFGWFPKEWDSMVDPKVNPTMAKVFGGMTAQQKIDSINKLNSITPKAIEDLVKEMGGSDNTAYLLKTRLQEIRLIRDVLQKKNPSAMAGAIAPVLTGADKHKLTPDEVPIAPSFITKNAAILKENQDAVDKVKSAAIAGDLGAVEQVFKDSKSPKVQQYALEAAATMKSKAMGPVPVAASVSKTEASIASKAGTPEAKAGLDKIGHYSVLDKLPPHAIPAHSVSAKKSSAQWALGKSYYDKQPGEVRSALQHYTGGGYYPMNKSLREGKPSPAALLVAKAMMGAPLLKEGSTLTRRHGLDDADKEKLLLAGPGTIIQEKGILSTSTKTSAWSGSVTLNITVGKGVRGLPAKGFSHHPSESEVMLPPNTRFLVTNVTKSSSGYSTTVHVMALPTEDNQCCPP